MRSMIKHLKKTLKIKSKMSESQIRIAAIMGMMALAYMALIIGFYIAG